MILDVFSDDAFSVVELTEAINTLPYVPSLLGSKGLFTQRGVRTTSVAIEERQGRLSLLSTAARGTLPRYEQERRRKMRLFNVPHIPIMDVVQADDVSGVRQFGSETELESVSGLINDKMEAMRQDMEVTWEWHRLGAIKGEILDGDGQTVIYNLFTEFELEQEEVTFDFADTGTYDDADPAQDMKTKALEVWTKMQNALGGTAFTGIGALCGDAFFNNFVSHATVRKAFGIYQQNGNFGLVQQNQRVGAPPFSFGNVQWEAYRGSVGDIQFVADDECYFYPLGVPRLFMQYNAPANFVETVNTIGLPIYAKQERTKFDMGVELFVQSNPLFICTRPKCLIKGVDETAG